MQQPGSITFGTPLAPTSTATGNTFGGFGANTGLKFGAAQIPTSAPSLFGTAATSAAPGLQFGAPTTAGFNFGNTTQPTGLFASTNNTLGTNTTTSTGLNFGATPLGLGNQPKPTTTNSPSVGLGGVDTFQSKPGQTGNVVKEADKGVKDNMLPNEFLQLIDGFKNHIKQQKMLSSDVARGTIKPIRKINEDIDGLKSTLTEIGNAMATNRQVAEKLKFDTAKCLSHAEMAQRIHDTPPGFQIDNSSTLAYFIETVNKFECDLSGIRQQIEATEKHIKSLERPRTLSSQEMTLGLRRLHETFVALAGRLQSIHSQVEMQKDQYLNMRKYFLKDSTNIFDKPESNDDAISKMIAQSQLALPKRAAGPTPFSSLNISTPFSFINQPTSGNVVPQTAPPAYPVLGQPSLSWGNTTSVAAGVRTTQPPSYNSSIGLGLNSTSSFGNATLPTQSNDFQLQKPPTGNKRGKH